ncbi:MAG: two-component system NarL family response regulator [Halocynthiibacter sp.]|jgi:two-component system nitrate/nitrite response regulator NarL
MSETAPTAPIRVLIVDDHPMVAEGIRAILETWDDISVVGTLGSGAEAVAAAARLLPDVILLDLNMPGIGGLSAAEMILEQTPKTRIVILSMHDSPEYISAALAHGARGYILKDVPTEEIRTALFTVMAGGQYLCTGAAASLKPKTKDGREPLTGREQTVLLELAQGQSNKDVAQSLEISVRTVETHRKNIKRKLGISSTAGLTRYALEHGVLQGTGVNL